jgi:hypothetical protein
MALPSQQMRLPVRTHRRVSTAVQAKLTTKTPAAKTTKGGMSLESRIPYRDICIELAELRKTCCSLPCSIALNVCVRVRVVLTCPRSLLLLHHRQLATHCSPSRNMACIWDLLTPYRHNTSQDKFPRPRPDSQGLNWQAELGRQGDTEAVVRRAQGEDRQGVQAGPVLQLHHRQDQAAVYVPLKNVVVNAVCRQEGHLIIWLPVQSGKQKCFCNAGFPFPLGPTFTRNTVRYEVGCWYCRGAPASQNSDSAQRERGSRGCSALLTPNGYELCVSSY